MASGRLIYLVGSHSWDSVARYVLDLCRHFRKEGWSVTAYTPDVTAVDRMYQREGVDLRHLPLSGVTDLYTLRYLVRDLKREQQGAVIHVNRVRDAFVALAARRLARRKDMRVVLTRHISEPGRDSRLARRVYRNLDAIIFTSSFACSRFISSWEGKPLPFHPGKMKILHYAVDTETIHPLPEPEKGPVVALWHGSLRPGKGLETLIDALPLLRGKRIRVQIAGTGHPDYVDTLRRRAAMNGVLQMIDWKGRFPDVWELTATSHFGVSVSEGNDAFGYSNIEYMVGGRAQIITPGHIQAEYLTGGKEALVIPAGDPEALASAMDKLASDPELRMRLGTSARRRCAADLSYSRLADEMSKVYHPEK